MKTVTLLSTALLCILVAGCGHTGVSGFSTVPRPAANPPIAPIISAINAPLEAVAASNAAMASKIAVLRSDAASAKVAAAGAEQRAAALAKEGKATQQQLNEALDDTKQAQATISDQAFKIDDLGKVIDTQTGQMGNLRTAVQAGIQASVLADSAIKAWGTAFDASQNQVKAVSNELVVMTKDRDAERSRADTNGVYKHWVWAVAGIVALYFGLRMVKLTPFGKIWLCWLP